MPAATQTRPTRRELVRAFGNAWNLSTPLGLAIARAGSARIQPGTGGLWLAEGYLLRFPVASAFTVGNVLITPSDFPTLGPDVLAHEEAHTWQWLWLGPLFLPVYIAAMGWSWLRTGDRAARNFLERKAGLTRGGYVDVPLRGWFGSRAGGLTPSAGQGSTARSGTRAGQPTGHAASPRAADGAS